MTRTASLEIHKDELAFCAGHFTIFSATEREHLHGHNYNVSVAFELEVGSNGLSFDYRHYKRKLKSLCDEIDSYFLLPDHSPFLKIEDLGDYLTAEFNHKKIPFLKEDVKILPVTNITIEELANWFLQNITRDERELAQHGIHAITIKVFNGPGQSSGASFSTTPTRDLSRNLATF